VNSEGLARPACGTAAPARRTGRVSPRRPTLPLGGIRGGGSAPGRLSPAWRQIGSRPKVAIRSSPGRWGGSPCLPADTHPSGGSRPRLVLDDEDGFGGGRWMGIPERVRYSLAQRHRQVHLPQHLHLLRGALPPIPSRSTTPLPLASGNVSLLIPLPASPRASFLQSLCTS